MDTFRLIAERKKTTSWGKARFKPNKNSVPQSAMPSSETSSLLRMSTVLDNKVYVHFAKSHFPAF